MQDVVDSVCTGLMKEREERISSLREICFIPVLLKRTCLLKRRHYAVDMTPSCDSILRKITRICYRILLQNIALASESENLSHIVSSDEMQEARAAGCRTSAEADKYFELKRKREAEEKALRENSQLGQNATVASEAGKDPTSLIHGQTVFTSANDLDFGRYPGEELLSEAEKQLCQEIKIPPHLYLKMQETLSVQIFCGTVTNNVDAYRLFDMEPGKIDRIYDMLIRKGIAPS
ncbi:Transcriptional adapter ADA2b [Bienertia sinuspersici]